MEERIDFINNLNENNNSLGDKFNLQKYLNKFSSRYDAKVTIEGDRPSNYKLFAKIDIENKHRNFSDRSIVDLRIYSYVGQNIALENPFKIELINERDYPIYTSGSGDINVNARDTQLYFKVKGFTSVTKTERFDWKTKNEFRWNDGTRTKDYPVINSHTYTMN